MSSAADLTPAERDAAFKRADNQVLACRKKVARAERRALQALSDCLAKTRSALDYLDYERCAEAHQMAVYRLHGAERNREKYR